MDSAISGRSCGGIGQTDFEELIFRSVSQDGKSLVDTDAWPVDRGAMRS